LILLAWSGENLYRFRIHGWEYDVDDCVGVNFSNDLYQVSLLDFALHRRECFHYEYDFTAGWKLEIRLEDILTLQPNRSYPVCIRAKELLRRRIVAALAPTSNSWTDTAMISHSMI
jgi:hypothetical protein